MSGQLKRWAAWALAAGAAVTTALVFAAWLSPEGAFSFVMLASFCG